MHSRTLRSPLRRAITIVEAAISVVIVAVLLVAALGTLGAVARARSVQAAQCQAPALARALMAEIRQTRYTDDLVPAGPLGPESNEVSAKDRSVFDDVDDYNGYSEPAPQGRDGTPLAGAGNFSRQVTVEWVRPDQPDTVINADAGLKRVTVIVTGAASNAKLVALVSKYGAPEQTPRVTTHTTYVTGVCVQLKISETSRVYSATSLSNQVSAQ